MRSFETEVDAQACNVSQELHVDLDKTDKFRLLKTFDLVELSLQRLCNTYGLYKTNNKLQVHDQLDPS